jgi:hypothetical protein
MKKKKSPKTKKDKAVKEHFNKGKSYDTAKKRKAIELFKANLGLDKPLTNYQIFINSGYDERSARQQVNILAGIKNDPIYQNFEKWAERHKARLLQKMDERLECDELDYGDAARGVSIINKALALGGGKPTEIVKFIDDQQRKQLDEIIEDNEDEEDEE